jgi:hypothetical protein
MEVYEFLDPRSGTKTVLNVSRIAAVQLPDKGRVVDVFFSDTEKLSLSCGSVERAIEEFVKIRAALAHAQRH